MKKTTLRLTSGVLLSSLFLGHVSVVDIAKAEENKQVFETNNRNKNIATKITSENNKNYLVLTAATDVENLNLTVKLGDQEKKFKHDKIKAGESVKFELVLPKNQTSQNSTSNRVVNPAKTDAKLIAGTDEARETLTTEVLVEGLKITTTVSYNVEASKVSVQAVSSNSTSEVSSRALTAPVKTQTQLVEEKAAENNPVGAPLAPVKEVATDYPTVTPTEELTLAQVAPVVLVNATSLMQEKGSEVSATVAPTPVVTTQAAPVTTKAPVAVVTTKAAPATTKAPAVTTQAAPATTKAPVVTTQAAPATTKAPVVTTQAAPATTKAPVVTTQAAPATTKAPAVTTQAAPATTKVPVAAVTTQAAPATTKAPVAVVTTKATPATTKAPVVTTQAAPATTKAPVVTTQAAPATTKAPVAAVTTQAAPATTKAPVVTTQAAPATTKAPVAAVTTQAAPATTKAAVATTTATKVMPFANSNYKITSPYGKIRNISSLGLTDIHNGVDFVTSNSKESILSTEAGVVSGAGTWYDGAQYVTIKHSNNSYTSYWHLANNSITVKQGQQVKAGQKIGTIGTTGQSTGIHLHFMHSTTEQWWDTHKDPMKYLSNATMTGSNNAVGGAVAPATRKAAATTTTAATRKAAVATTTTTAKKTR
ncbi:MULTISPECIES: M23 family metallopeptidase [unclassified Gemella]|uniref:M23 family metallopeptidase n=1 Tax=unclassified Gemella TaxID=2624949 RepID=UPI0015D0553C|nr:MULTISPECIES: M23 family metallopeptidase [unclassified Gemella]MBF0710360.1 peptidoglycan DD-metalloendopeptidase family protein [Gemella sp. GL1.1]NYS27704.1 peptidoglycan DD-metalloendopeptidase family protein [Gemella sp. GL1]